jgi:hypothetical protein
MKVCPGCHEEKRIEEYYVSKSQCKTCCKARDKRYREANRARLNEYDRQRNKAEHRVADRAKRASTGKGRASMRQRREKFVETNPLKRSAHVAVRAALKRGEMRREPCQFVELATGQRCYAKATEGHHEDYTKPLEVVWLCKKHHDERHVMLRNQERTGQILPWKIARNWDDGIELAPF